MSYDDAAYFLARADAELRSACRANNAAAIHAHMRLSALYREKAAELEPADFGARSAISAGQDVA